METFAITAFAVFLRVTGFLIILPGFSSVRVPLQIRLFVAFGVSMLVILINGEPAIEIERNAVAIIELLFVEFLVGASFALPVRFLFLSILAFGELVTNFIGLNPLPGSPVGDSQPSTTLSSLFHITAVVILFTTGAHVQLILGLSQTYSLVPVAQGLDLAVFLENIVNRLSYFFVVILRLAAPIIIYSIVVNFVAGIINKLTPQVPVYFVSAPFLIGGGIVIMVVLADEIMTGFLVEITNVMALML